MYFNAHNEIIVNYCSFHIQVYSLTRKHVFQNQSRVNFEQKVKGMHFLVGNLASSVHLRSTACADDQNK